MKRTAVVLLATLVACGGKKEQSDNGEAAKPAAATKKPPVGPSVTPVVTKSITFFVPKDAPWWGEMSFACYSGLIRLQPGSDPADAFTKISPLLAPALRAAHLDIGRDVTAIGLWGCGKGACAYFAANLRSPEKLAALLGGLVPGMALNTVGPNHYSVDTGGATGPRTIHVQAVPIAWPEQLPSDTWSKDAARATHLVFVTGLFPNTQLADPLAAGLDAKAATAKIADLEAVAPDPRGRCIVGEAGKTDFQPGYGLDHARFALVAPEGKSDAITGLLGSKRTLDLEVELVLSPAPSEQVVAGWIAQARQFVRGTAETVRAQLAGQGAMVDVIIEVGGLLGSSGFRHTLHDKSLTLSFRTDRISAAEVQASDAKLRAALGQGF